MREKQPWTSKDCKLCQMKPGSANVTVNPKYLCWQHQPVATPPPAAEGGQGS